MYAPAQPIGCALVASCCACMTQALPRTHFNTSRFVRLLTGLTVADAGEIKQDAAERLGQWLDVNDAIALYTAHGARSPTLSNTSPSENFAASAALEREFVRLRTNLAQTIAKSCSPHGGEMRIKLPTPSPGAPLEIATAYEPYRRFYLAHQRDMDASIRPLRAKARDALSAASPTLARLAALDAALDDSLWAHERRLLATTPALLEKRFEQQLKAHRQTLTETAQTDNPALWMQPGSWLANFCQELQATLLAELDVRLQPTAGLIEAFGNKVIDINE